MSSNSSTRLLFLCVLLVLFESLHNAEKCPRTKNVHIKLKSASEATKRLDGILTDQYCGHFDKRSEFILKSLIEDEEFSIMLKEDLNHYNTHLAVLVEFFSLLCPSRPGTGFTILVFEEIAKKMEPHFKANVFIQGEFVKVDLDRKWLVWDILDHKYYYISPKEGPKSNICGIKCSEIVHIVVTLFKTYYSDITDPKKRKAYQQDTKFKNKLKATIILLIQICYKSNAYIEPEIIPPLDHETNNELSPAILPPADNNNSDGLSQRGTIEPKLCDSEGYCGIVRNNSKVVFAISAISAIGLILYFTEAIPWALKLVGLMNPDPSPTEPTTFRSTNSSVSSHTTTTLSKYVIVIVVVLLLTAAVFAFAWYHYQESLSSERSKAKSKKDKKGKRVRKKKDEKEKRVHKKFQDGSSSPSSPLSNDSKVSGISKMNSSTQRTASSLVASLPADAPTALFAPSDYQNLYHNKGSKRTATSDVVKNIKLSTAASASPTGSSESSVLSKAHPEAASPKPKKSPQRKASPTQVVRVSKRPKTPSVIEQKKKKKKH